MADQEQIFTKTNKGLISIMYKELISYKSIGKKTKNPVAKWAHSLNEQLQRKRYRPIN